MKVFCIHIPRSAHLNGGGVAESANNAAKLLDGLLAETFSVLNKNDFFSFEIFCYKQIIYFTFACNENIANHIKGVLYAASPYCDIREISDYLSNIDADNFEVLSANLKLKRNSIFPIKCYQEFLSDSLTNLINQLASFSLEDSALIQIVCKPFKVGSFFTRIFNTKVRRDRLKRMLTTVKYWINDTPHEEYLKSAEQKCFKSSLCAVNIRVAAFIPKGLAPRERSVRRLYNNMSLISDAFKSYNHDLNGFKMGVIKYGADNLSKFFKRIIDKQYSLFSTSELATIWHIPSIENITNIPTVLSVKVAPPKDLPIDIYDPNIAYFGTTDYRDVKINFGIRKEDRRRHLYILGKSGNGKSSLINLLAKNDIMSGAGLCVLDPHGDLIDNLLTIIPRDRIKDVIIFDPTDIDYPVVFNPFYDVSNGNRLPFVSSFIEVFKKIFSSIWNDNLEHLLRCALLAVLSSKNEGLLSIKKLLTDKDFRLALAKKTPDSAASNFFINEFDKWQHKFYNEAVLPLLEKIDSFVSNEYLENIFLQKDSKFNFREIIDNNKILLLKLPKGILGDENVSLLGSMLVFKIYHAAMSRADIPEHRRRDFYFYIDEFHSFMTESVNQILSEARKYKLNLTMANQYLKQLPVEVVDTIFGNIANIVVFGTGADDASRLAKELAPIVSENDIMNLAPRSIYVKMSINSEVSAPFSATTLDVAKFSKRDFSKECIAYSRKNYSLSKEDVEKLYGKIDGDKDYAKVRTKDYDEDYSEDYKEDYSEDNNEDYEEDYSDEDYEEYYKEYYKEDLKEDEKEDYDESFESVESVNEQSNYLEDVNEDVNKNINIKSKRNNLSSNLSSNLSENFSNNIKNDFKRNLRCYGTVLLLSYLGICDDMLEVFSDNAFSKVEELDLKGTSISDDALKYLRMLPELLELKLDGTNITSRGLKNLIKLRSLDLLSLNDTEIDDKGIYYLTWLSIENLSLRNTNITNDAAQYFCKIKNLDVLDIRGTLIDEATAEQLKATMKGLIVIF